MTAAAQGSTARAIFQLDTDVPDFSLGAGSYWLSWGIEGSLSSGPWQPPTSDGVVGNARQSLAGGPFNEIVDTGDGLGVELPFIIRGTVDGTVVPEPATWAMLLIGGAGLMGIARRRRVIE